MYPMNLFIDVCGDTTPLKKCLDKLNTSFNTANEYFIINLDASSGQTNKMAQTFLWHIQDYYKQDSGYVFDILKKQHYQTLIISSHKNQQECFVGGVLYVICPIEGSLVFSCILKKSSDQKVWGFCFFNLYKE